MQGYGVREVERLIGLPARAIRALIASGVVSPERGKRNAWRFSFQDLIVLRTAQALADAHVPRRQIARLVRELRRSLPASMPLSSLSLAAVGNCVVVREGGTHWQADSGQYLLQFDGAADDDGPSIIARQLADAAARLSDIGSPEPSARDWFDQGVALESSDADAAASAYERAVSRHPEFPDAHINLGRLWHEAGNLAAAEALYRDALRIRKDDATLLYNLGVVLQDQGRDFDAIETYEAAVRANEDCADAYYNLAQLCHKHGRKHEVIRYLGRYRTLQRERP